MKKTAIALAVTAAFAGAAYAQSTATVYGILDMGYTVRQDDITTVATGAVNKIKTTNTADASTFTSSRLGFKGTEDIGGGLKANFQIEFGLLDSTSSTIGGSADTANSLSTRQLNAGLSGAFGAVTLGRQNVLAENVWSIGNVGVSNNVRGTLYRTSSAATLGASGFSSLGNFKGFGSRVDRAITYTTPELAPGLKASVQYGEDKNQTTDNVNTGAKDMGANATYSAGPLNVGFGYNQQTLRSGTTDLTENEVTAYNLAANYDFGMAKVFGIYTNVEQKTKSNGLLVSGFKPSDRDGFELGVSVPVQGATSVFVSGFSAEDKQDDGDGETAKVKYTGYQVGALYSFSKRTNAYAAYGYEKLKDGNLATGLTLKSDQYALGIRHSF